MIRETNKREREREREGERENDRMGVYWYQPGTCMTCCVLSGMHMHCLMRLDESHLKGGEFLSIYAI